MLYRDNVGALADSMATVREISTPEALMAHLVNRHAKLGRVVGFGFKPIGYDERTGWQTYYVMAILAYVDKPFVAGMSNACSF